MKPMHKSKHEGAQNRPATQNRKSLTAVFATNQYKNAVEAMQKKPKEPNSAQPQLNAASCLTAVSISSDGNVAVIAA
jgi:hypothetical protein